MRQLGIVVVLLAIVVTGCGDDKTVTPVEQKTTVPGFGIARTFWRPSSQPATADPSVSEQAHVAWFNPIDGIPITEIWDRDIGTGEASTTDVLEVHFKPVDHKYVRDTINNIIDSTSVPIEPERSWAGFMANPPISLFTANPGDVILEMRLRVGGGWSQHGAHMIMHFDIGRISEDIDGDMYLDTEDKNDNSRLDDGEDVGLDGLADQYEFGYNPQAGVYDPTGDNFDINNIWRINGTEKNRNDPDNGGRPNTEDPDFNGLQIYNDYYSSAIDLGDTLYPNSFYVAGSMNEYGWMTLRIPLTDGRAVDTIVGSPSWDQIRQIRIWFDSATTLNVPPEGYVVEIAAMELTMTGWSSVVIPADSIRSAPHFGTGFISSELDSRYVPPPAYTPSYEILTSALPKGQTLDLGFDNLQTGIPVYDPDSGLVLAADTVMAVRLLSALDLREYCWLDVSVWGDRYVGSDSIMFFFRFGSSDSVYYEYRSRIHPGWDPDNFVHANLIWLEEIAAQLVADRAGGFDSSLIRFDPWGNALAKIDSQGHRPFVSAISYMAAGLVNLDGSSPASGEVWINGIRLTGLRFW